MMKLMQQVQGLIYMNLPSFAGLLTMFLFSSSIVSSDA